jgi:hypothetical protein
MVKSLIMIVAWHTPQNRIIDTITHVTPNTMSGVEVGLTIIGNPKKVQNSI